MSEVYVDCDGTLLDDRTDILFRSKVIEMGMEAALDWYHNNCPDDLELNIAIWLRLVQYKAEGYKLSLWTNRGPNQIWNTIINLQRWGICDMFDSFVFGNGQKTNIKIKEAIVLDNEYDNIKNAVNGEYIPTFTI